MRILITGVTGFVGRHLFAYLSQSNRDVWGLDRVQPDYIDSPSRFLQIDLDDPPGTLNGAIRQIQPTHVFHLAGVLGNVSIETLYQVNVLGTIHLLEALHLANSPSRVLIASSSGVYGATIPEQNPLTEACPLRPISHYGASKLAQENVGRQYYYAYQIPIIIARTFNLLGPGLSLALLASNLAQQIVLREFGQQDSPILIGNLWPKRDYVDVHDAVRAYAALIDMGQPSAAYNVCTGRSYSVQDCLDVLLSQAHVPVQVQQVPARMRLEEIADQTGCPARLQQTTNWQAAIPFEQSLTDILDYWRTTLKTEVTP